MAVKLFLHGVPDSPAIWRPLQQQLGLPADQMFVPALPGFETPLPKGFAATKEAYVDWVLAEIETIFRQHGPVDVIGHDWGAMIIQRAAMLRPELIRSWIISNAVIEPQYRGHRVAHIWRTPILGELFMALAKPERLARTLKSSGVPADIADEAAVLWRVEGKKKAILKLYRSVAALGFKDNWARDIPNLPANGALIWGENDRFVPFSVAERYAKATATPLFRVAGAGHWAIAERPAEVAEIMRRFWTSL